MTQFIKSEYVKEHTSLYNNTNPKYIDSAIEIAQQIGLQSILGTFFYKEIEKSIEEEKVAEKGFKELLEDYIQPYLCQQVISDLIVEISFKIGNGGVAQYQTDSQSLSDRNTIDYVKTFYQNRADFYKERLQRYVCANFNSYLKTESSSDLKPNTYSAETCSIFLGNNRGK